MKSKKLVLIITMLFLLSIPGMALAADNTLANFEDGTIQGWIADEDGAAEWGEGSFSLQPESENVFAGSGSLKVILKGDNTKYKIVASPQVLETVEVGKTYTFHVFIPADSNVTEINPYIQFKDDWSGWMNGNFADLKKGEWNTITYEIPADATKPFMAFGFLVMTADAKEAVIYIDSVDDGSGSITEDASAPAENPKTGDAGLVLFLALAGISGTVMASRKRSK